MLKRIPGQTSQINLLVNSTSNTQHKLLKHSLTSLKCHVISFFLDRNLAGWVEVYLAMCPAEHCVWTSFGQVKLRSKSPVSLKASDATVTVI